MLDDSDEIIKDAKKVTLNNDLCDSCLGRLFTKKFLKLENEEIGKKIRKELKNNKILSVNCSLCNGLIDEIDVLIELIVESISRYEFETFLIGCKVDEDVLKKEKNLQDSLESSYCESIKREINRKIGKKIEELTGKIVDFDDPDIMIKVDVDYYVVNLQIKPLFIYGRYKKIMRGIPQTKWFCRTCRGIGCKKCNYTGKLYPNSVEELISKKVLDVTKGSDETFHGCGREDIDALMLGDGRPFVLEIKDPQKRRIDLKKAEREINKYCGEKVEVLNLRFADSDEKIRLKSSKFRKHYRIVFNAERSINIEKLKKAVERLQDCKIKQRTPSRVAHRRANMVRERQIYQCELKSLDGAIAVLEIEAESGTYVKELVSGDNGRTEPNVSDMIDNPCVVTQLDVLEVRGE